MAKNVTNDLTYFIELAIDRENDLGNIRHWNHLQVGFEGQSIWVKGFVRAQIDGKDIKTIPYVKRYYNQGAKLFRFGSKLPDQNIPSVLWTPIGRGLPITLPKRNFNYFGVEEKIVFSLIASEDQRSAAAMMIDLDDLGNYISTASAIRLQQLSWTILDSKKALIIGKPLLPIPGKAFWKRQDFLIPLGFDFDQHVLSGILHQQINSNQNQWIVWDQKANYFRVEKENLSPLSLASFRKSIDRPVV